MKLAAKPATGYLWGLLLVIVTFLAYQPVWRGQPIWDDAAHLTPPARRGLDGLGRIWFEPGETQQYYPVVHSVFWVEHKIWGDSTLGYHLVNILLHVTAALLLFTILRELQVPAAGLAAAIFALHPLQVETVAWMTELKNTLSAVCYFGSALALLRFDRSRNKAAYACALALFVTGLLAKSVIATLPAAMLVVFWWQRGKLSWKQDVVPLLPFFAAGIGAGLFTAWVERHFLGAQGAEFNFSIVERFLIAGRAVCFYLGKLFWPADLVFSYPRWNINQAAGWQYLFPIGVAALLGGLWFFRRKARGPLAALLFFIGTLFPALGFFNVFPFKYSFVADHFQYLACCGPIVAACVGLHAIFRGRRLVWERTFCALLLAALGLLTWRQSRMYTDMETLWRTTLQRNPESWLAQNDLGSLLYDRGKVDEAIVLFRKALALQPDDAEAVNNLGAALDKKGLLDEAIVQYQKALALRPFFAEAHRNLGDALLRKGQVDEAILQFQQAVALRPDLARPRHNLADALLQQGRVDEAILQYQKLLEFHLDEAGAHYNLGVALLQKGRTDEALLQFQAEAALRPDNAEAQNNLGYMLLQKGRADEAIGHLQKALDVRPDYPEARYNLGNALLKKRRVDDAILQFQKILAGDPGSLPARKKLADIAWRLATSSNPGQRNSSKALELARQTDQLAHGGDPKIAATLAAAYAEAGQFNQAVAAARRALQLAQTNAGLSSAIQAQLRYYEAGSPFHVKAAAP